MNSRKNKSGEQSHASKEIIENRIVWSSFREDFMKPYTSCQIQLLHLDILSFFSQDSRCLNTEN